MTKMKAARISRGLSLQEVGYRTRVQAPHLSQIERGLLKPYPPQAKRLARFLGLDVEELLEEAEPEAVHG